MSKNESSKCSSCGNKIPKGKEFYVNNEWQRAGFVFCKDCVTSLRARKCAEEHLVEKDIIT